MAKPFHIKNAKVQIDGKDGYRAHTWTLAIGIDKAEVIISCYDLDDALKLSIKKNPRPDILLIDLCGVELRYSTVLMKAERTPVKDGIDQIDYHFKIIG